MRIAFVGLGHMGRPMAENLLKAGHTLVAYNRGCAVLEALAAKGALTATSRREALAGAEVFMTCLLLPEQLCEVYFGELGILEKIEPGQLFIAFETVEPGLSREIGAAVTAKGGRFLDAPISGGPKGAAAATLSIMVGGALDDFSAARPLFEKLGNKIFHMGPVGAGTSTKICNQILTGVTHALVCEAMVLGTKAGLEPRALYDVLRQSSGQSNSLERAVANFILPGKFEAAYPVEGIIKDLECAIRTAKSLGVRFMFAPLARQLYIEAARLGHAREDVASVIKPMERIAGVIVRDIGVDA
jgi:3-hydroxyisobutyrate dehydrogenase-like beta-hydroxyacid dehydrogenase